MVITVGDDEAPAGDRHPGRRVERRAGDTPGVGGRAGHRALTEHDIRARAVGGRDQVVDQDSVVAGIRDDQSGAVGRHALRRGEGVGGCSRPALVLERRELVALPHHEVRIRVARSRGRRVDQDAVVVPIRHDHATRGDRDVERVVVAVSLGVGGAERRLPLLEVGGRGRGRDRREIEHAVVLAVGDEEVRRGRVADVQAARERQGVGGRRRAPVFVVDHPARLTDERRSGLTVGDGGRVVVDDPVVVRVRDPHLVVPHGKTTRRVEGVSGDGTAAVRRDRHEVGLTEHRVRRVTRRGGRRDVEEHPVVVGVGDDDAAVGGVAVDVEGRIDEHVLGTVEGRRGRRSPAVHEPHREAALAENDRRRRVVAGRDTRPDQDAVVLGVCHRQLPTRDGESHRRGEAATVRRCVPLVGRVVVEVRLPNHDVGRRAIRQIVEAGGRAQDIVEDQDAVVTAVADEELVGVRRVVHVGRRPEGRRGGRRTRGRATVRQRVGQVALTEHGERARVVSGRQAVEDQHAMIVGVGHEEVVDTGEHRAPDRHRTFDVERPTRTEEAALVDVRGRRIDRPHEEGARLTGAEERRVLEGDIGVGRRGDGGRSGGGVGDSRRTGHLDPRRATGGGHQRVERPRDRQRRAVTEDDQDATVGGRGGERPERRCRTEGVGSDRRGEVPRDRLTARDRDRQVELAEDRVPFVHRAVAVHVVVLRATEGGRVRGHVGDRDGGRRGANVVATRVFDVDRSRRANVDVAHPGHEVRGGPEDDLDLVATGNGLSQHRARTEGVADGLEVER